MSVRRASRATIVAVLLAVLGAGAALASAPLLHTGKAYDTSHVKGLKHGLALTYLVSASNPKRLLAGPNPPPLGSQFAVSVGGVSCPKAKRNPGLPKADHVFAEFGFPGANLKLSHGRYGFSVSRTVAREFVFGSTAKPFRLKVKITGTVVSPTAIAGKLTVEGGPCTVKGPIAYTAKLDSKAPVAPGD